MDEYKKLLGKWFYKEPKGDFIFKPYYVLILNNKVVGNFLKIDSITLFSPIVKSEVEVSSGSWTKDLKVWNPILDKVLLNKLNKAAIKGIFNARI